MKTLDSSHLEINNSIIRKNNNHQRPTNLPNENYEWYEI